MRILVLKDEKIGKVNCNYITKQVGAIYSDNTPVTPTFHVEERDFEDLIFSDYYGGNLGIDQSLLRVICNDVYNRWQEEIDYVTFLVHEDNWHAGRVWGWNLSAKFNGYEVNQVRYDKDNTANTVGTFYHETMHAVDSFIFRNTGVHIEPIVGVTDWDHAVVHGGDARYDYIRYKHNTDALSAVGDLLKKASDARVALFEKKVGLYKQIIQKMQQVLELQRMLLMQRQKSDVPYTEKGCS